VSTLVDNPARPEPAVRAPRWWWWSELLGLGVVVLVGLALVSSTASDVNAAAADAAARAIELSSPAEHHDHGHEFTGGDKAFCGVHVFGLEPASARTIAEVRTVYGYYFCAIGRPGLGYLDSNRADGPVVVRLGAQPTVLIAAPGTGYADRVRAMMPDEYEEQCFHGLPNDAIAVDVKSRYLAEFAG
jgi:hypothetical protein